MNYQLQGTAPLLKPRRAEPLIRMRVHSLAGILAALPRRRRTGSLPHPGSRASAGTGVSPFAAGASRGVTFLSRW